MDIIVIVMSSYKIDIRIPVKAFRRSPFLYFGPDFRSLTLGFLSDFIEHDGKQFQRLYPMTVVEDNGEKEKDVLFSFIYLYVNNNNRIVVHLTHPIYLNDSYYEALNALLLENVKLAKFVQSSTIELEVQSSRVGQVFFPSSPSIINFGSKDPNFTEFDASFLKENGFSKVNEVACFENDIEYLEKSFNQVQNENEESKVRIKEPQEFIDAKNSNRFDNSSYHLTEIDSIFKDTNIPFFENTAIVKTRKKGLIFKKEVIEGVLRWSPNLFEPVMEKRIPCPFIFYSLLENYRYEGGKIFDWGFKGDDVGVLKNMIIRATGLMKEVGIKKIQFGNVKGDKKSIEKMLENIGFNEIQRLKIYRRVIKN